MFLNWTDIQEPYDSSDTMNRLKLTGPINNQYPYTFIEGDNYPVLKLLKKDYENKIDLIYIDPPYNTGNTFTYNDKFYKASPNADRHSAWLSFMQRRLLAAKELLSESGCIFIAIDQSELYFLKLLCDQIFGEENFINDFMWLHGKGKKDTWSRTLQQNTLCYAKNKKQLKPFTEFEYSDWATKNADNDPRGNWFSGSISFTESRSNPNHKNYFTIESPSGIKWTRQWQCSKDEMEALLKDNKIFFGNAPDYSAVPRVKIFNNEKTEVIPKNIIDFSDSTRQAQRHLDEILGAKGVFDNPKPVNLIKHLIKIANLKPGATIMDFFAGSGTTMEAVYELNSTEGTNYNCILVQKPEQTWEYDSKASKTKIARKGCENAFNAGFNTISEICVKRIQSLTSCINYKTLIDTTE